jgi:MoaA/NifB/PqqE/SkfB family radical SAM enzyme
VFRLTGCFIGWHNVFIDYNGNVGLCCHNEKLVAGNLRNATLEEIWKGKKAHDLRLLCKYRFDTRRAPFKGECEWCHWHQANLSTAGKLDKLRHA